MATVILLLLAACPSLLTALESERLHCQVSSDTDGNSGDATAPLVENFGYKLFLSIGGPDSALRHRNCLWRFPLVNLSKAIVVMEKSHENRKVTIGDRIPNMSVTITAPNGTKVRDFLRNDTNVTLVTMEKGDVLEFRLAVDIARALDALLFLNVFLVTENSCPSGCNYQGSCYIVRPAAFICGSSHLRDCVLQTKCANLCSVSAETAADLLRDCEAAEEFVKAAENIGTGCISRDRADAAVLWKVFDGDTDNCLKQSVTTGNRSQEVPSNRSQELPSNRIQELPSNGSQELPSNRSQELPSNRSQELPSNRSQELPSNRSQELPSNQSQEVPSDAKSCTNGYACIVIALVVLAVIVVHVVICCPWSRMIRAWNRRANGQQTQLGNNSAPLLPLEQSSV